MTFCVIIRNIHLICKLYSIVVKGCPRKCLAYYDHKMTPSFKYVMFLILISKRDIHFKQIMERMIWKFVTMAQHWYVQDCWIVAIEWVIILKRYCERDIEYRISFQQYSLINIFKCLCAQFRFSPRPNAKMVCVEELFHDAAQKSFLFIFLFQHEGIDFEVRPGVKKINVHAFNFRLMWLQYFGDNIFSERWFVCQCEEKNFSACRFLTTTNSPLRLVCVFPFYWANKFRFFNCDTNEQTIRLQCLTNNLHKQKWFSSNPNAIRLI